MAAPEEVSRSYSLCVSRSRRACGRYTIKYYAAHRNFRLGEARLQEHPVDDIRNEWKAMSLDSSLHFVFSFPCIDFRCERLVSPRDFASVMLSLHSSDRLSQRSRFRSCNMPFSRTWPVPGRLRGGRGMYIQWPRLPKISYSKS